MIGEIAGESSSVDTKMDAARRLLEQLLANGVVEREAPKSASDRGYTLTAMGRLALNLLVSP